MPYYRKDSWPVLSVEYLQKHGNINTDPIHSTTPNGKAVLIPIKIGMNIVLPPSLNTDWKSGFAILTKVSVFDIPPALMKRLKMKAHQETLN